MNLKMANSGLVECPEVEQLRPCNFFNKGLCPSCYSLAAFPLRRATSRHIHKATPRRGLVRLGTYIEILERHWRTFKLGRGRWDCCGAEWFRPDFPTRPYFLITRGLEPEGVYRRVSEDEHSVNIQVSVDILPDGKIVPGEERLKWFLSSPKTIFRFKTTMANVSQFQALANRLELETGRVMETPLRVPLKNRIMETSLEEGAFCYGRKTPLERVGWYWKNFGRCNTKCSDCVKENGVLLCSARPRTLSVLSQVQRREPPRHNMMLPHLHWKYEAELCLRQHGGQVTVREAYEWFKNQYPVLEVGKPNWQFKVRVALQRAGVRGDQPSSWRLPAVRPPDSEPMETPIPCRLRDFGLPSTPVSLRLEE